MIIFLGKINSSVSHRWRLSC